MRRFALLVAGLALLAGVPSAASGGATQAEDRWVITDLGTLGGKESYAAAINAKGQVVGWAKTKKGRTHPFLWQSDRMRDLGAMDHPSGWATAINDHGQIIGRFQAVWKDEYEGYASAQLGFVWERGFMTGLTPDPDGYLDTPDDAGTEVRALNERGQMVGSADAEYYEPHAYLWKKPDFSERGSSYPYHHEGVFLTTRQLSAAYGINEHDQAVGESQASYKAPLHAALWENGQLTDLGTLGGVSSSARAINDNGQVVGKSQVATSRWHAFIWREEASTSLLAGRKGLVLKVAAA